MRYKLGKLDATRSDSDLRLSDYLDHAVVLPTVPEVFGTYDPGDWGMLGNDEVGNCVFAGGAHEHVKFTYEGGAPAPFSATNTISDYSAVTGYIPGDPSTDRGTDVRTAMAYRQQTGLLDAVGNRHKLATALALDPGNYDQIIVAAYLFEAVGIGVQLPETAQEQFQTPDPVWSVIAGAQIEGGHYVPIMGRAANGNLEPVTWAKKIQMTPGFLTTYCDEAWVPVSWEFLNNGKSIEGFNKDQLMADLAAI